MSPSAILKIISGRYDKKTLDHVMRVAEYTTEGSLFVLARELMLDISMLYSAALLHDILEDTDFKPCRQEDPDLWQIVDVLTKPKTQTYEDYLKNIKMRMKLDDIGKYAYIIKLADMKDHLNRKETLTDKLKEKYLNGLAILL